MNEIGDAQSYDKGIVKGMMIAGQILGVVTKEDIMEMVERERLRVFGNRGEPNK